MLCSSMLGLSINFNFLTLHLSHRMTKPTKLPVRPAKTQISMGIFAQSDQSLRCALYG